MKRTAAILAFALLLCGCREDNVSEEFRLSDELRIEIKGYTTFRYNPMTCQIAYNRDKCEFRVHTDNMSDFYALKLAQYPAETGQTISGTVSWTTGSNIHNKKTTFEVLKLEGDKIWLWSSRNKIALVVRSLE